MRHQTPENIINELLTTSESMYSCAENSEWENVAELDITRRNLFAALLENPADEIAHLSNEVKAIFSINKKVINLASEARSQVAKSQQALNINRQGTDAYRATQDGHPKP